ncbi:hypothetical protein FRX31_015515 [Thalictrum thalictroides]|uniref:Uncharacterized protein n=1 Tax=Thalictrum thalictroides TaxID=46969 RepID=A0A7J6WC02_THATH|nr:hypothetical protein FRX31_015515 [Thalictrum thalictroides]
MIYYSGNSPPPPVPKNNVHKHLPKQTSSKPLVTSITRDMGGGQSSNPTSSKPLVTSTSDICEAADIFVEVQYDRFWDKYQSQLKDGKVKNHVSLDDDVYNEGTFYDSKEVMVDTPEWGTK